MTDLWTLIAWFFYGFVRYVMFWIPLITPFRVERNVPHAWWRWCSFGDWRHRNDNNGGPDEHWLQCWFRMVFGEALNTATETVRPIIFELENRVRGWIGGISHRFPSLGQWIDHVERLIGYYVPSWAGSVAYGLDWLRDRLPAGIRQGWQSWYEFVENIKTSVRSWVRGYVDHFRELADRAWNWAQGVGEGLAHWRDLVSGWINGFMRDPYGYVTSLLGESWAWLRGFRNRGRDQVLEWLGPNIHSLLQFGQDCVGFYYRLWSVGWRELGEFAENPANYVVDLLERTLAERW